LSPGFALHEQPPQRRTIDAERAGRLRPAYPFTDHAAGVIKLVRREFRQTAACRPRRRAAAMPALVLSEITLSSNSEIAPTIENTMRPTAVLVSIPSMIDCNRPVPRP
jgi:hypothetical protein